MARPLRIEFDGAVYHVTSRGNARRPIYKDVPDRAKFLDLLEKTNKKHNWLCHAYCLMNNHYHLIIETPDGNLSAGMRQLNGVYTQTYNRRHRKVGHVFQGRYKAIVIEKESHLLEVCRYVVLNPVRARIIEHPQAWKWSSYMATAGRAKPHPCLTTEWVWGQFGSKLKQAQKQYRAFVMAGMDEESILKKAKGQSVLGDEGFVDAIMVYLKRQKDIEEIPRKQRFLQRPSLHAILPNDIKKDQNKRTDAIRKAVLEHGYNQREVAKQIGVHYSTISRIINKE